jgi:hypothetical protein
MSDTITKWHEMQEEERALANEQLKQLEERERQPAKFIFLLDFVDGKVYRYDISALCTEHNTWNPDHESCEAFLYGAGHSLKDCEWMATDTQNIEYGN